MWNKKPFVDSQIRNFDYIADHLAPEVSSSDAGKVMTVDDDGKWIAGSSGGVLAVLYLKVDPYSPDNEVYVVDYINKSVNERLTFADIKTIYESSSLLILKYVKPIDLIESDYQTISCDIVLTVSEGDTDINNNMSVVTAGMYEVAPAIIEETSDNIFKYTSV